MKTEIRLYDNYDHAKDVVADLETAGVPHAHITIVAAQAPESHTEAAKDAGIGATAGAMLGGGAGLLAGLGMIAIPGIGPVVAAGWLATALAGAVVGGGAGAATGGLIGALTEHGISEQEAHVYAESLRRGGALVAVKEDDKCAAAIHQILDTHQSIDPTRSADYRSSGWSAFDAATTYTPPNRNLPRT